MGTVVFTSCKGTAEGAPAQTGGMKKDSAEGATIIHETGWEHVSIHLTVRLLAGNMLPYILQPGFYGQVSPGTALWQMQQHCRLPQARHLYGRGADGTTSLEYHIDKSRFALQAKMEESIVETNIAEFLTAWFVLNSRWRKTRRNQPVIHGLCIIMHYGIW